MSAENAFIGTSLWLVYATWKESIGLFVLLWASIITKSWLAAGHRCSCNLAILMVHGGDCDLSGAWNVITEFLKYYICPVGLMDFLTQMFISQILASVG